MIEAFEWIKGIIESCQNNFHLEGSEILVNLFGDKYKREGEDHYNLLIQHLVDKKTFISVDA